MVIKPCKRKKRPTSTGAGFQPSTVCAAEIRWFFRFTTLTTTKVIDVTHPHPPPKQKKTKLPIVSGRNFLHPCPCQKKGHRFGAFFFYHLFFSRQKNSKKKKAEFYLRVFFQAKFPKPECTSALFLAKNPLPCPSGKGSKPRAFWHAP